MGDPAPYDVLPLGRVRRATGRRMHASVTQTPHVTLHGSADATALLGEHRRRVRELSAGGARVTLTALLARVVAASLREFPRLNGRTEDGEIRLYHAVNLGIAVSLEDGLTVPVIRDADRKPTADIAQELWGLSDRARAGRLRPADLSDGTFTLSNLGAFGVEHFTPIINPPQLGILGTGTIVPTPSMNDGRLCEQPRLGLSLSFDHAALDGAQAAQFLAIVARRVAEAEV